MRWWILSLIESGLGHSSSYPSATPDITSMSLEKAVLMTGQSHYSEDPVVSAVSL